MANRKAIQDAEVAEKTVEKGLLIVHTGKGKGKSTAAWGLLLRAWAAGFRCGVVQFGKGGLAERRARRHRAARRPSRVAHVGRRLHLGDAGPQP